MPLALSLPDGRQTRGHALTRGSTRNARALGARARLQLPAAERTVDAAVRLLPERWSALAEERPELVEMIEASDDLDDVTWLEGAAELVERWFELEDPQRLEPAERELYVETEIEGLTLRAASSTDSTSQQTGRCTVVDYKTGRSPREGFEAKALFQMKFYALVLWRLRGEIPKVLQLVYLGDRQVVRHVPDEQDLRGMERNVKAVWAAVQRAAETGDWRPSRSRLCGWCDFRDLCPEFGGTPPPLPEGGCTPALRPEASGQVVVGDD